MKESKKIMFLPMLSALIFLSSGCHLPERPAGVIILPEVTEGPQSSFISKKYEQITTKSPTVVESAMELSEKYAKLSEEAAELRQKNLALATDNRRIKDRFGALQTQLQRAQTELTEANDLLIEMRIELNNWKTDILGFRDEIRQADTAQLDALLKILKVLGGETSTGSVQGEDVPSAAASPGAAAGPGIDKTQL